MHRPTRRVITHAAREPNGSFNYQILGKATIRGVLPVGRIYSSSIAQVAPSSSLERHNLFHPQEAGVQRALASAAAEKGVKQEHHSSQAILPKALLGIQPHPGHASPVPPNLQQAPEPDTGVKDFGILKPPAREEYPQAIFILHVKSPKALAMLPTVERRPQLLHAAQDTGSTSRVASPSLSLPDLCSDYGTMISSSELISIVPFEHEDAIVFKGRGSPASFPADYEDEVVFKGRGTHAPSDDEHS